VLSADSAVTVNYTDGHRYEAGLKAYMYPGVGCVATWGSRTRNHIGFFLRNQNISPATHSIDDLADLVNRYLKHEYRPDDPDEGDVGYHVTGFNQEKRCRLYHVFWGFDRSRPPDQPSRRYRKYPHHPQPASIAFLYNGRNDIAETLIYLMLEQIAEEQEIRFDLKNLVDIVCFNDFVVRFAAELTPEVDRPFYTFLISPENKIEQIKNARLYPLKRDLVAQKLRKLGYSGLE
jgi:hypothetical protein